MSVVEDLLVRCCGPHAGRDQNSQSVQRGSRGSLGAYSKAAGTERQAERLRSESFCERKLAGKRIALFGSYGWGDGEWMRAWHTRCAEAGESFAAEDVICCEAPDDAGKANCIALGKAMT